MATIRNIRRTVNEYDNTPRGFHVEVWSSRAKDGAIEVWTSDLLSQNSWTENHAEDERRLDTEMAAWRAWNPNLSTTALIRRAVADTWGVE